MRLQAILDIIEIVIAILNSKQPVSLAKDWASMLTIVEYPLMNSCQFLRASHLQCFGLKWPSGKYDTQVRLFQESTLDKWHLYSVLFLEGPTLLSWFILVFTGKQIH